MRLEEMKAGNMEPALDVESSPRMEPVCVLAADAPASAVLPRNYWQAQAFAEALHREFEEAEARGDVKTLRERFYVLAHYYGRTLAILRHALAECREPLLKATLHNLTSLHQPLHHMHAIAPTNVPLALTLDREMRRRLIEDLTVEVLQEVTEPIDLDTITRRVNELHLLGNARKPVVLTHLENLIATGHVNSQKDHYTRTHRPYAAVNLDQASLQALLGLKLYQEFERGGFHGLSDIARRKGAFRNFFTGFTGFGQEAADLFAVASMEVLGPPSVAPDLTPWHHDDLIGSVYPRPYQYDAYAIFRGYGYQGQVIEAPTGSGKTLIGMMCIQDWLRGLSPGESILILVPTVNYQQQWVGELCHKPIGLRLTPDILFAGTPAGLESERERTGASPAVLLMTYSALAQTGSGTGKGGFDRHSIEIFLQGNRLQYVILDEVHKVVEDLRSVSADVARLLTEWLRDGSLRGVIGFSGTAAAYRQRFSKLGLKLVYTMPAADLIAYGFVAPFAEFGVPFAYSDREQHIRNLLEEYKVLLREFIDLIGSERLRNWFADIPMDERVAIGRDLLRMYAGRKDRDTALVARFEAWEHGEELNLNELPLITTVQIARNRSDESLVNDAGAELAEEERAVRLARFQGLREQIERIRSELKGHIYFPDMVRRLEATGFGVTFDGESIKRLPVEAPSMVFLGERVKDGVATTMAGLYDTLKNFYFRVGEGRVDCIKSIIEAERAARRVTGVIVFDAGKRIQWEAGTAVPGYTGVAGVFAQTLGDSRFTPMAALSSEMYMPWSERNPLPNRIASFIKQEIMRKELGEALFSLMTRGLGMTDEQLANLHRSFESILALYVRELARVRASRPAEFDREVLVPIRREVAQAKMGGIADKLLARLSLKHHHIRKWVDTFFDYALIITYFLEAHVAQLQQVSGALQKFFIVRMAEGERKQLMYDLTARIVDAEDLGVNMIIVSPWARTGWNVIRPNILIDATATRNVTAWQQLRGRAMRAMRTWDRDCYRLVMALLGTHDSGIDESQKIPADAAIALEAFHQKSEALEQLDEGSRGLLAEVHEEATPLMEGDPSNAARGKDRLAKKIRRGILTDFTAGEREQLVAEMMLVRNKVTHIYEMIKAYGSAPQVHYDRAVREWRRPDSIAAKHAHEYSVSPVTGHYGSGEEHAPLIYFRDPRKNLPSQLRRHLKRALNERDPIIVRGWLSAIASGMGEEVGSE